MNAFISYLKRFCYGAHLDPARDWLVLLTLSAIAFAGLVVWNVRAFDTVVNGGSIGAVATSTPPSIFNQASFDAIQVIFSDRAAEKAKYETSAYRFADPSQ